MRVSSSGARSLFLAAVLGLASLAGCGPGDVPRGSVSGKVTLNNQPLAPAGVRDNGGMRILHTADWHLGDRLGRIDRTADLRASVERVAAYCEQERADVLLMAGDLFSELSRPDGLRDTIAHLDEVFRPF